MNVVLQRNATNSDVCVVQGAPETVSNIVMMLVVAEMPVGDTVSAIVKFFCCSWIDDMV